MVYNDFLNDVLKGPTHLQFFMYSQRVISQIINGDESLSNNKEDVPLNRQHLKIERVSELI